MDRNLLSLTRLTASALQDVNLPAPKFASLLSNLSTTKVLSGMPYRGPNFESDIRFPNSSTYPCAQQISEQHCKHINFGVRVAKDAPQQDWFYPTTSLHEVVQACSNAIRFSRSGSYYCLHLYEYKHCGVVSPARQHAHHNVLTHSMQSTPRGKCSKSCA